jgi:hypothetical protein
MIELKRNCPKCNCDILYKSKESLRNANKNNSSCRKCSSKDSGFTDRYSSDKNSGSKNPFFGKKHNDISKRNMSLVDKSKYKTSEFKEKMRGVVNRGDSHHVRKFG